MRSSCLAVLILLGCSGASNPPPATIDAAGPADAATPVEVAIDVSDDAGQDAGEDEPVTPPNPLKALAIPAIMPSWTVVVPATVNGTEASFLLDTGAGPLALTPELAKTLGKKTIATFAFAGHTFTDVTFIQHDLTLVSGLLGVTLSGNLGRQHLGDRVIAIDYKKATVYPLDAWTDDLDFGPHVAGGFAAVDLTPAKNHILVVMARFEGLTEDTAVIVDTGTNSALISETLFDELPIEEDGRKVLKGSTAVAGGIGAESDIVRVRTCTVGGQVAHRMWASVGSDSYFKGVSFVIGVPVKAILGGAFLREFVAAIDYPGSKLRLAAYTDLGHVQNEFRAVGVEVIRQSEAFQIFNVFAGTDAEAKGIVAGDTVTSLDGAPAAAMTTEEITAHLRGEPGTELSMTLEGKSGPYTVNVTREDLLPDL